MSFDYYYDLLKNVSTDELLKRQDDEQYVKEYRIVCKKIIEARARGEEQEIYIDEKEFEEEINDGLKTDREVPKSIDECRKMDKTTKSLLALSESVEKWGSIMLALIILAGIIVAVISGLLARTTAEMEYMLTEEVRNTAFHAIAAFLGTLLRWVVYAVLEYWTYKIIALFIAALASIVHSNRITANISLYNAKKQDKDECPDV